MREKIGKLECLVRKSDTVNVKGECKRSVVLMHGFGADAGDLYPLADFLDPDAQWDFYFPEAPLEVSIGPGMVGRAWFPISLRELEQGVDFSQVVPPGMMASRDLICDMIFHLNSSDLILGGFSQGAMLATEVALHEPDEVKGLILFSGALLSQANWTAKVGRLTGKPLLQSHGTRDQVIPFSVGQKLYDMLNGAEMKGSFHAFNGGHEIPLPVLNKTKEFLGRM